MALVQVCDFVSDCFVVFGEFRTHPAMLPQYFFSAFMMATSLIGAWLWIFLRLHGIRKKLVAALLAPVNLHTFYIGGLYTYAEAKLPRSPTAKDLEHVESLYALFIGLKVAEAATESFIVGVLTLNAWALGESDNDLLLFSSSVISVISLAYGMFSYISWRPQFQPALNARKNARLQLFTCMFLYTGLASAWAAHLAAGPVGGRPRLRCLVPDAVAAKHHEREYRWSSCPSISETIHGCYDDDNCCSGQCEVTSDPQIPTMMVSTGVCSPAPCSMDCGTPCTQPPSELLSPPPEQSPRRPSPPPASPPPPQDAMSYITVRPFTIVGGGGMGLFWLTGLLILSGYAYGTFAIIVRVFKGSDVTGSGGKKLLVVLMLFPFAIAFALLDINLVWPPPNYHTSYLIRSMAHLKFLFCWAYPLITSFAFRSSIYRTAFFSNCCVVCAFVIARIYVLVGLEETGSFWIPPDLIGLCERFFESSCPGCRTMHHAHPSAEPNLPRPSAQLGQDLAPLRTGSAEQQAAKDALEELIYQLESKAASGAEAERPVLVELQRRCKDVLSELQTMDPARLEHVVDALGEYVPSPEAGSKHGQFRKDNSPSSSDSIWRAEEKLLEQLDAPESTSSSAISLKPHPMRAVPLSKCLQSSLWRAGRAVSDNANYVLSREAGACDWFISHNWGDDGEKKVAMLRDFLCLQQLVAGTLVVSLVLAVFLAPLGFAVFGSSSPLAAVLPCVPLAIALGILLWVRWSRRGLITRRTPWSVSAVTLWIDKTCVDQDNVADFLADGLSKFLFKCDGVVAFISEQYFTRLWCVYELAAFCRRHRDDLKNRLLLFSLDWPTSICSHVPETIHKEAEWLRNFSCKTAHCFKPIDRATVLSFIRQEWGSEQAFDEFVHNELPGVLRASKRRYLRTFRTEVFKTIDIVLGD